MASHFNASVPHFNPALPYDLEVKYTNAHCDEWWGKVMQNGVATRISGCAFTESGCKADMERKIAAFDTEQFKDMGIDLKDNVGE